MATQEILYSFPPLGDAAWPTQEVDGAAPPETHFPSSPHCGHCEPRTGKEETESLVMTSLSRLPRHQEGTDWRSPSRRNLTFHIPVSPTPSGPLLL